MLLFSLLPLRHQEAAQALFNAEQAGSKRTHLHDQIRQYLTEAEKLKSSLEHKQTPKSVASSTDQQACLSRAQYLMTDAAAEDERGSTSEALDLYSTAVELLLSLVSALTFTH